MAAKVGILEPGQLIGSQPKTYVSKCVAALMCRRLEAEQIEGYRLIRRLIIRAAQVIKNCLPQHKSFIPDKLPPNIDSMLGIIVVGIPRKVYKPNEIMP